MTVSSETDWDLGSGIEAISIFSFTLSLQSLMNVGEMAVGRVRIDVTR